MEAFLKPTVTIGRPSAVKFNFGVVGESGAGRRTFIKAFTDPYDFGHSDCLVHVVPETDLASEILRDKHNAWLEGYKNPATDQQRNASDNRVHCVFYMFSPHRVLPEDRERIVRLQGLAPIVPVLAKADSMTPSEREEQLLAVQQMMSEISRDATLPVFFDFQESDQAVDLMTSQESDIDLLQGDKSIPKDTQDYQFPTDDAERIRSNSDFTDDSFKPVDAISQTADNMTYTRTRRVQNVFSVVCAVNPEGQRVYPWGTVDIHDEAVSDLRRLQRLVFENGNIGRLRELTQQMSIRHHAENMLNKGNGRTLVLHPVSNNWMLMLGLTAFLGAIVVLRAMLLILANI